jgi:uncharacterized protein (TIGR03435 family)
MGFRDLLLTAIAAASFVGQARPSFDAVSIKPSASSGGQLVRPVGDRVVAEDVSLRALIQFAYQSTGGRRFFSSQIVDAPRWVETDRFDVQAKAVAADGPIGTRQLQLMTQAMLEDRFQLRAHRGMRELPVYDFVASKSGIKLKPAADQTPPPVDGDPLTLDPSTLPRGKFKQMARPSPSGAITLIIIGSAVTLSAVINLLQQYVDRPIVNSTGAAGLYDIRLEFGLPQSQSATEDAPGVSLFTAVQEQLGLKLEAVKKPIEVLVIDRAEHPTAD